MAKASGSINFDPGPGSRILTSFGHQGASDAFVARYTRAGELVWVDQFGEATASADHLNRGTALALDPAGNLLVAGNYLGSPDFDPGATAYRLTSLGAADGFIIKLTPSGALAP